MNYISLFSGIEAATVAWKPFGWRPLVFSEIDPHASGLLTQRHSSVPNAGDITQHDWRQYRNAADIVVGGSPCQSFSVAGLRQGMADPRGNLTLEYLSAVGEIRPRWVVWENVPGVLSSDKGRTFGAILGTLANLGYGFAYRVLDAQFVRTRRFLRAVPQRRRRVFVVGYLGNWRPAAAVLFDPESMRGNPPPRRETGEDSAEALTGRPDGTSGVDAVAASITASMAKNGGCAAGKDSTPHNLIAYGGNNCSGPIDVATAVNAHGGACGRLDFESETFVAHTLRGEGFDASEDGIGRGTPLAVAFAENQRSEVRGSSTVSLNTGGGKPGQGYPAVSVSQHDDEPTDTVRRLTPLECERLQGFPDQYTAIESRRRAVKGPEADYLRHHGSDVEAAKNGKLYTRILADGHRYKMIGNSMAVNCMEWIGQRIYDVEW